MIKGIAFALGACFIWGLIFVVPQFMTGFSSIEIVLGRYAFYGMISAAIFIKAFAGRGCRYPRSIWLKALHFSLISTLVYYIFLVLALRYASPAVCALILGVTPISIAFYGNFRHREIPFKSLVLPSLFILIGLVLVNIPYLEAGPVTAQYLLGLFFSVCSLIAWSWYVVANAQFLKEHRHVHSSDWSTLMGVSTLVWVILFTSILLIFFQEEIHLSQYAVYSDDLKRFLIGSAILGLLCSWVGSYLWNKASLHLPVPLAGQLTIFETIFGVVFVYLVNQHVPSAMEWGGMIILLAAIAYGTHHFTQKMAKVMTPH
jgi:drug/metabolite transporter (DMT)-like permease